MGLINCNMFISIRVFGTQEAPTLLGKSLCKWKKGSKKGSKEGRQEDQGKCMTSPILQAAPFLKEHSTHHHVCYINIYFMETFFNIF